MCMANTCSQNTVSVTHSSCIMCTHSVCTCTFTPSSLSLHSCCKVCCLGYHVILCHNLTSCLGFTGHPKTQKPQISTKERLTKWVKSATVGVSTGPSSTMLGSHIKGTTWFPDVVLLLVSTVPKSTFLVLVSILTLVCGVCIWLTKNDSPAWCHCVSLDAWLDFGEGECVELSFDVPGWKHPIHIFVEDYHVRYPVIEEDRPGTYQMRMMKMKT